MICLGPESPVCEETMKERGSMYEHFPLCGSARAAIRGRLLKKPFYTKHRFSEENKYVLLLCWRVILGVAEKISESL